MRIVILVIAAFCLSEAAENCYPLNIEMCRNHGYSLTTLSSAEQSEEELKIKQFIPVIATTCSKDLEKFLCNSYAPACDATTHQKIPACHATCLSVKAECDSLIRNFGFTWPDNLKCDEFRDDSANPLCKSNSCYPLNIEMCKDQGYTLTTLNSTEQSEEEVTMKQYFPLIAINCSKDLATIICNSYVPACDPTSGQKIPACHSTCLSAKDGCGPLMKKFGFSWPAKLNCEELNNDSVNSSCTK